jgi:hypothetical protein
MKLNRDSKFAHRHNGDGTVDSICLTCYQTAATTESESQLQALESQHKCDPCDMLALAARDLLQFPDRDKESA